MHFRFMRNEGYRKCMAKYYPRSESLFESQMDAAPTHCIAFIKARA